MAALPKHSKSKHTTPKGSKQARQTHLWVAPTAVEEAHTWVVGTCYHTAGESWAVGTHVIFFFNGFQLCCLALVDILCVFEYLIHRFWCLYRCLLIKCWVMALLPPSSACWEFDDYASQDYKKYSSASFHFICSLLLIIMLCVFPYRVLLTHLNHAIDTSE